MPTSTVIKVDGLTYPATRYTISNGELALMDDTRTDIQDCAYIVWAKGAWQVVEVPVQD